MLVIPIWPKVTGQGGFHLDRFLNFEWLKGVVVLLSELGLSVDDSKNFGSARCLLILRWKFIQIFSKNT